MSSRETPLAFALGLSRRKVARAAPLSRRRAFRRSGPRIFHAHNEAARFGETEGGHDFAITPEGFLVDRLGFSLLR